MRFFPLLLLFWGCIDPDLRRGRDALGQGRYLESIHFIQKALEREPLDKALQQDLAGAHRAQAMRLLQEGRCGEASAHLLEAERRTSALLVDHQALYDCSLGQASSAEAQLKQLKRLFELGERRARIRRKLMRLQLQEGHYQAATAHLEPLEQRMVLRFEDRLLLARAFLQLQRFQEAEQQLGEVVRQDPRDALARLKLAELKERRGDQEGARQTYLALSHDFSKNPVVFLRLSRFLHSIGELEGARLAQKRADLLRGVHLERQKMRPLKRSRR